MADDPFDASGDGDRTVFRPNPGGRRPASSLTRNPAPLGGDPSGPSRLPPGPTASSDPFHRDDRGATAWGGVFGRPVAARPALLERDRMIVPHGNPIMRAAGPMLLLLGRLHIAAMRASFAELMGHVAESVRAFDADVRGAGIADAEATTAKYVLCATADDIVQNIPSEDRSLWAQYSMLSSFFGERVGGVRFFALLDASLADPTHHVELLELQHACLALGFQGRYRTQDNGQAALHDLQRRTYEVLKSVRPAPPEGLSPKWRGLDLRSRAGGVRVPIWVIASILLAGLAALYLTYLSLLTGRAEAAATEMLGLHPPARIALSRRVPAPPPPAPTPPPPAPADAPPTQLQRIRSALAPEISSGDAAADAAGTHIIVRVGANFLFESGKADVKPGLKPVAQRIAQTLETEPGPIQVIGHTDTTPLASGSRFRSNFDLSMERARRVALLLQADLSQPARVKPDGRGEQEPVAANDTAENKTRNRRVEIWIDRSD